MWLLSALILGTILAVATPAFKGPDEPAHLAYVAALAQGHLPTAGPVNLQTGATYELQHPPAYYLAAAPLYWAFAGHGTAALFALRLINVLLLGAVVWLVHQCGTLLFDARAGWLAASLLSVHATFIYCEALFNNEPLALFFGTACLYCALKSRPGGQVGPDQDGAGVKVAGDHWLWRAALWGGLALLTKLTALPLILAASLLVRRPGTRYISVPQLQIVGGAALLYAPWAVVMLVRYGTLAPPLFKPLFASFGEVLLLPGQALEATGVILATLAQGLCGPFFLAFPLITSIRWYFPIFGGGGLLLLLVAIWCCFRPRIRFAGWGLAVICLMMVYQGLLRDRDVLVTASRYAAPVLPLLCLGLAYELSLRDARLQNIFLRAWQFFSVGSFGFLLYFYRHGL